MDLILIRIDDRLIHGQVTVGWVQVLNPDRILLANDAVAKNRMQRKLFEAVVPPEIRTSVLTIEETIKEATAGTISDEKTLLIIESPRDALALLRGRVNIKHINVGGLHHVEGKRRLLSYVFVNEQDIYDFKELIAEGVEVECRDVPSAKRVDMRDLL